MAGGSPAGRSWSPPRRRRSATPGHFEAPALLMAPSGPVRDLVSRGRPPRLPRRRRLPRPPPAVPACRGCPTVTACRGRRPSPPTEAARRRQCRSPPAVPRPTGEATDAEVAQPTPQSRIGSWRGAVRCPTDRHCRAGLSPRWAASLVARRSSACRPSRSAISSCARERIGPQCAIAVGSCRRAFATRTPRPIASTACCEQGRRRGRVAAVASGRAMHVRHAGHRCGVRLPPCSQRAHVPQAGHRPGVPLRGCHRVRRESQRAPRSGDRGAVVLGAGFRARGIRDPRTFDPLTGYASCFGAFHAISMATGSTT